jgi:predicted lipoprotein with Yx(FWY)xxD motif
MSLYKKMGLVVLLASSLAACVSMSDGKSIVKTENGMLVSMNNMTVYTFDGDQVGSGRSSCYADCEINWPPLLVDQNATSYGDYSILTRDDGKKQFAYKGKPLYYYRLDNKPDETNGNNLANGAWRIVRM